MWKRMKLDYDIENPPWDEAEVERRLLDLCDLYRRTKFWPDNQIENTLCSVCFHPSPRIAVVGMSFLLNLEKIKDDDGDGDFENKEAMQKGEGTTLSKKKEKQCLSYETSNREYRSPLYRLYNAKGFSKKLFSHLQYISNEKIEAQMMMMIQVIARTVSIHRLILLDFYPYLQKYIEPHKRDVTALLAAAVEACHDRVPPKAVQPLCMEIVNQFVHDRSRPEDITVALNVVHEMCLRMPSLMDVDLLEDLSYYRESLEKAVSASAGSPLTQFRKIFPSLLVKKDIAQRAELRAKPKAFGGVLVPSNAPGVELLDDGGDEDDEVSDDDGSDEDDETSDESEDNDE